MYNKYNFKVAKAIRLAIMASATATATATVSVSTYAFSALESEE